MNEFRRAYDYDDERGVAGLLLLFVLSLVSFDLVAAIILLSQSGMMVGAYLPWFQVPYFVLWGIYFAGKIVFVILLFLKRKRAPRFARVFLSVRIVLFLGATAILYLLLLIHGNASPINLDDEMRSVWQITYGLLITPVVYTLGYSLGWMQYFKRSRRVRETYGTDVRP